MGTDHKLYLTKLNQFIYDEDKIVTLVWLCKELQLDAKICSDLMRQFTKDIKGTTKKLAITYIILGVLKESQKHVTLLLSETELNEKKKQFQSITSEYIYSVQKGETTNYNTLSLVDCFNIHGENGPIKSSFVGANCVKRSQLKTEKIMPTVVRAPSVDKSKASHMFARTKATSTSCKKEPEVKTEPKEAKTDGKETLTKQNSDEKKDKNNIVSMFQKVPSKEKKQEEEKVDVVDCDTSDNADRKNNENSKNSLYDSGTDEEAKKVEESNQKKKIQEPSKKQNKRKKRQRPDASNERSDKKRKRIIQQDDDSDDDIFANEEENADVSQDIIESDEEPVVKKPVQTEKNRKRKFVDKTYEAEDGYIVTKRELVYDSNPEDNEEEKQDLENKKPQSEEPPPKKKATPKEVSPKNGKNKKQAAKPTNQPTLMSFFKKK